MTHYDKQLYSRLVNASKAINAEQKTWLLEQEPHMPAEKKQRIFMAFAQEQTKRADINRRRLALNTEYMHRKTSIVNAYNETIETSQDFGLLADLEENMDNAFLS